MINLFLQAIVWSQILVPVVIIGLLLWQRQYVLEKPYLILLAGIGMAVYFVGVIALVTGGAWLAGCENFNEGGVTRCIVWGQDISSGVYAVNLTGWFSMIILPLAFLVGFTGFVMMFGWLGVVKGIGILFGLAIVGGLLQGIISGIK